MTHPILESDWFKGRPRVIQEMVARTPPAEYVLETTGQYVELYSYFEDGTVSVLVDVEKSLLKSKVVSVLPYDYIVFGIDPGDLSNNG